MNTSESYDLFAPVYNRHWGHSFSSRVWPVLERLLLPDLPSGARILDLCCGTGQLARTLTERGFSVIGLDASTGMLNYARDNAPRAEFIQADARLFLLPPMYHAVISTFDSLNHLLDPAELAAVFRHVHQALLPQGLFLFDLNMEEKFKAHWHGSFAFVADDQACAVRAHYEPARRIGHYDVTIFRLDETWHRSDFRIDERCYTEEEIRAALAEAGFTGIDTYDAEADLGLRGEAGRSLFRCRR